MLSSVVSNAIMAYDGARPSRVVACGFEYGASGAIEELLKKYRFDRRGIVELVNGVLR